MQFTPGHAHRLAAAAVITTLITTACDTNGINGLPEDEALGSLAFSRAITIPELDSVIDEGPVRVEVELRSGQLIAREVEIETGDELTHDEKIESRITAIAVSSGQGTLDLALAGGFSLDFTSTAEFEGQDGEDLTFDEFVTWVQDELAAGREPVVEAKRPAPSAPQDPTDATFVATKLELDDDGDEDKIKLNVDSDNLDILTTPPPDARLTMLGIVIDIDTTNGVTEIEQEEDHVTGENKFKDLVESVDVAGGTFTLQNGTTIAVVEGTDIHHSSDGLESLQAVSDALDAGLSVRAKGKTVLEDGTLVAVKVKFKLTDHITFETFVSIVEAGPTRVEVSLVAGQLVAREVEIETGELTDEEELESHISGVTSAAGQGSLELTLNGGFVVDFDSSTEIEGPDGEDFTLDEFVAWVEAEVAAGRQPAIEAKRPAPTTPQDPTTSTFFATELELDDEGGKEKLEINIDSDNLEVLTTPPPDARLTILGIVIDIDVTNDVTELELED